jgi:hypothetical protein
LLGQSLGLWIGDEIAIRQRHVFADAVYVASRVVDAGAADEDELTGLGEAAHDGAGTKDVGGEHLRIGTPVTNGSRGVNHRVDWRRIDQRAPGHVPGSVLDQPGEPKAAGRSATEGQDPVAVVDQTLDEPATDEPGGTGHRD